MKRQEVFTISALAVVAYALSNIVHEGVGHGGMCLLVGGHPLSLSAVAFDHDGASVNANRAIAAGGTIANLVFFGIAWTALKLTRPGPVLRYFLWLFCAVNLLDGAGYLMFSGLGGVGDWVTVIEGLPAHALLRALMAVVGALLYFWVAARLLMSELAAFVGVGAGHQRRATLLGVVPYLAGGILFVIAGLPNPYGFKILMISAVAAAFGGTSLLAWYPRVWFRKREGSGPGLIVSGSIAPYLAAVIVAGVFIVVLGPGIPLGR